MKVQTFVVEHGQVPVIGVRVGGFAYITDVSRIPDDVWPVLEGLDTFVVGATRYKPHPNHFTFDQALEAARRVGARQTYFTHLSADYDHDPVDAMLPDGVNLAYDGLRIAVPMSGE
jgi:phosphoribosyl 1,2-cyclic phosphate phosphodiesterase